MEQKFTRKQWVKVTGMFQDFSLYLDAELLLFYEYRLSWLFTQSLKIVDNLLLLNTIIIS